MKKIITMMGLVATVAGHAQETQAPRKITYTTEADVARAAEQHRQDDAVNEQAFYQYPVGKTFWVKAWAEEKAPFYKRVERTITGAKYWEGLKPDATVSFKVTELLVYPKKYAGNDYAYRVVIEDGTEAYMDHRLFGYYSEGTRSDNRIGHVTDNPAQAIKETSSYLFSEDPDKLALVYREAEKLKAEQEQARLQAQAEAQRKSEATAVAQRAAAQREAKRKGGVRLGMTSAQVKASNWGKPESVNRTTDAYGVHEQWVYGGRNYLYFENGVLTSIQN